MIDRRLRLGPGPSYRRTKKIAKLQQRAQVISRSRGSAPRASSAARLLRPPIGGCPGVVAQIGDRRLSRRLMWLHAREDAGNLEKRLAIEEVGGEEEAVFRRKAWSTRAMAWVRCASSAGTGEGSGSRAGCRGVEWGLAVGAAVVIDVPLRERGAQPAEQRAAAGVRSQRRLAHAVDLAQAYSSA